MKNQPLTSKLKNAVAGIRYAWRNEDNIRTQAGLAVVTIIVFLLVQPAWTWWALIVICIALVVAAELVNSALETLIDHLHPEVHPAIGRAKDVLAGMVLVVSFAAAVVGLLALVSSLR
ncbi:MAG: diacylglycerol kinase [Thiogranum sp.]